MTVTANRRFWSILFWLCFVGFVFEFIYDAGDDAMLWVIAMLITLRGCLS